MRQSQTKVTLQCLYQNSTNQMVFGNFGAKFQIFEIEENSNFAIKIQMTKDKEWLGIVRQVS